MSKRKSVNRKAKISTSSPKMTIQELQASRDGGQIALRGFTFQFLYSCYLILSETEINTAFHLEGIEDIDQIEYEDSANKITHVQLKYSAAKQDASFLKDVLKNFLETFLLDKFRNFKLVYDFSVAKGNMSKLFSNNLDETATSYWKGIINQIRTENPLWNWTDFNFNNFISKLIFEKKEKSILAEEIEKELIKAYDISTDNVILFANGLKVCCLEKMEQRDSINKHDLDMLIQSIKDDISKGPQNPAHKWIKKINFDIIESDTDLSYFEGKKPTPQDIGMQLPVRRFQLEDKIKTSIRENRVTVIKSSSGQGKTTLALQAAYFLRNVYTTYQLLWCNDSKELNNIVIFFKSRVKLGEKPLILIDNLDSQVGEWNRMAQLFQEEISYNYKLLLTTREDDWYNYGGDLSNIKSLQIIKLALNEEEAHNIYEVLRKANKLHKFISSWQKSWAKVADRKLLIEYVYLLTHGEMLSERLDCQIKAMNDTDTGKIKCEILRKVCLADICGIKLPLKRLISNLVEPTMRDYGEILKSLDNEFLIRVDLNEKYVEGLHPVRSQHIVDKLHEFVDIDDTAIKVVGISDTSYFTKLFSNLPHIVINKKVFYLKVVETLWNSSELACYVLALQGLYSGSVMQYFHQYHHAFDDANEHGGLFLLSSDLCPFINFKEFGYKLETLSELHAIMPDDTNIQYLCDLSAMTPKLVLSETDVYCFCDALFNKLKGGELLEITNDIKSYSYIAYWLFNINSAFNLAKNISLKRIWDERESLCLDIMSSLMYTCYCGYREAYTSFTEANLENILTYLKAATQSLKVYTNDKNEIHIEYILLPSNIKKGNEESVSRLKSVCMMLPIFDTYCADSIKPNINILSGYNIPDDSHKAMPIRNLVIMFHQEFASLWNKTIMSNYECDSIVEWLEHWFLVRKDIIMLLKKDTICICRMLECKPLCGIAPELDNLCVKVIKYLIQEFNFPNEDRPFEEKPKIPEDFRKIKSDYFISVRNFCNQFAGFLIRNTDQTRLALINLKTALASLNRMQGFFDAIYEGQGLIQEKHSDLCLLEEQSLQSLWMACLYFKEHQPNKYFNKYQINVWYNEYYKGIIENAKNALSDISKIYSVVFPKCYYNDGVLNYFPIIVANLDMTNSDQLIKFLFGCVPFAELDFNYLVVACRNSSGIVLQTGLKITKELLKNLPTVINTDNTSQLTPPFPEEISSRFLDCFEHPYEILTPMTVAYEGIDKIAELLWKYSASQKVLTNERDMAYLKHIESNLKVVIIELLDTFKTKISTNDYKELSSLCNNVLNNGQQFDDKCFNAFIDRLITPTLDN